MKPLTVKRTVAIGDPTVAADYLAQCSGLPKARIKDAMNKGAVWIAKPGVARRRLRRATASLHPGDRLEFYYDEQLLAREPLLARCLADRRHYSVWIKPAGLMSQGNFYGDHCSLLRQAEQHFQPARGAFLVHRLDREACGLMLVAHTREAAARLSRLFQEQRVHKEYRVEVRGRPGEPGAVGRIDAPLDGKPALTEYTVVSCDPSTDTSVLKVVIRTGRKHQIRRHLESVGHPVMGDPRYGSGNKNAEGLRLAAVLLRFRCPFTRREEAFRLDAADCP